MNIHDRRINLKITTRELAREAGVCSSSISRLETGNGNTYMSTRNKVLEALRRLEEKYKNEPCSIDLLRTHYQYGRRRPDFVAARRLLGLNQRGLAAEFKISNQEISKIESGYARPDAALEMQCEAYLRAQLDRRKMAWPVIAKPTLNDLAKPSTFVPDAMERLGKEIFPDAPTPPTLEERRQANDHARAVLKSLCTPCSGTGIVWNPTTGQPFKCPLCQGD